jgi:hypothetical protein
MNVTVVQSGLALLILGGMGVGLMGMKVSLTDEREPPPSELRSRSAAAPPAPADSVWRAALQAAVDRAPFRASRRLADVAYDPDRRSDVALPAPAAPPKPSLVLSGLVWEREPAAVIEGFPGIDGPRVVHRGEVVGGLTVKRIQASGVVIAGLDTVWHLTVRAPWQ